MILLSSAVTTFHHRCIFAVAPTTSSHGKQRVMSAESTARLVARFLAPLACCDRTLLMAWNACCDAMLSGGFMYRMASVCS